MDSDAVAAEIAQVKEKIDKTEARIAEVIANIAEAKAQFESAPVDQKKMFFDRGDLLQKELIELRKEKNLLMERLPKAKDVQEVSEEDALLRKLHSDQITTLAEDRNWGEKYVYTIWYEPDEDGIISLDFALGTIYNKQHIVTCNHCLTKVNRETLQVCKYKEKNGKVEQADEIYGAEVERIDEDNDIALLRIKSDKEFDYPKSSSEVSRGDKCFLLGCPAGEKHSRELLIRDGLLSSINLCEQRFWLGIFRDEDNVLYDGGTNNANPGFSGGPVYDFRRQLIGIVKGGYSLCGGDKTVKHGKYRLVPSTYAQIIPVASISSLYFKCVPPIPFAGIQEDYSQSRKRQADEVLDDAQQPKKGRHDEPGGSRQK